MCCFLWINAYVWPMLWTSRWWSFQDLLFLNVFTQLTQVSALWSMLIFQVIPLFTVQPVLKHKDKYKYANTQSWAQYSWAGQQTTVRYFLSDSCPNLQLSQNVGSIYPVQIYILLNAHSPTPRPKGAQTPQTDMIILDNYCQQLGVCVSWRVSVRPLGAGLVNVHFVICLLVLDIYC